MSYVLGPVPSSPRASQRIILQRRDRRHAAEAAKLRKAGDHNLVVLRRLSEGTPVLFHDAVTACFWAMAAATTAKGQSVGRRADRAAIEQLWLAIMDVVKVSTEVDPEKKQPTFDVDFTDREQVEQWIEAD